MRIELTWYDKEETILYFKFLPGYTWDDLARAMEQGQALMAQKSHRVDWVYHGEGNQQYIPRGNPWHVLRAASQKIPDNTGLLFIVNPGMFVKMMQRIGQTAIPQSVRLLRFAPTFEDAIKLIHQERERLQRTP